MIAHESPETPPPIHRLRDLGLYVLDGHGLPIEHHQGSTVLLGGRCVLSAPYKDQDNG